MEEIETPEGFVTADPVEITVGDQSEVETVCMKNDTTKVEIENSLQMSTERKSSCLGGI